MIHWIHTRWVPVNYKQLFFTLLFDFDGKWKVQCQSLSCQRKRKGKKWKIKVKIEKGEEISLQKLTVTRLRERKVIWEEAEIDMLIIEVWKKITFTIVIVVRSREIRYGNIDRDARVHFLEYLLHKQKTKMKDDCKRWKSKQVSCQTVMMIKKSQL